MIINEKHRFVFIHIPKCAGSLARNRLKQFNTPKSKFSGSVGPHDILGELDYAHVPLFVLRDHFPRELKLVQEYNSYALIRDPFARFASSVSQHLRMYSDQPIHTRSLDQVRAAVSNCIDYLSCQSQDQQLLVPQYIHFQKQVDYIDLDGTRIVDRLYTVNELNELLVDVGRLVGIDLVQTAKGERDESANRSVVFRNDLLRRVIEGMRPVSNRLGQVLPIHVKQRIRERVYIPRDQRLREIFEYDHVQDFIRDYYVDDIALYQNMNRSKKDKAS